MTWLFIILDVLILLSIIAIGILSYMLWNKKNSLHRNSLEDFRNEGLYEKSKRDRIKLAHIDEKVDPETDVLEMTEETGCENIEDKDISFSDGYGFTESEVDDEY